MKRFETSLVAKVQVSFLEPEKAEKEYMGEKWKKTFWDFIDLQDLSENLANDFFWTDEEWNQNYSSYTKFIEGFGLFVKNENGVYQNTEDFRDGGKIEIKLVEKLEPTWTDEIS